MWMLGPVGFATPLLLWGLLALPVLWLLLRAVPPAPIRRRFPGVALLLGLADARAEADRTPWWLLVLRMLALAALILGFAGPVLNPEVRAQGGGPLLVVFDGGWAEAPDWQRRLDRAAQELERAGQAGRPVALIRLTDAPGAVAMQAAEAWSGRLAGLKPQPWLPDAGGWAKALPEGRFDTLWLSDGLDHPGRGALLAALQARGAVTVFTGNRPVFALHPATVEGGTIQLASSRLPAGEPLEVEVVARGPDPAGIDRELARGVLSFGLGAGRAQVALALPPELRNRVTRFELVGQRAAGAVALGDDGLKRKKIALIGGRDGREGLRLLSPLHYLRQALAPDADLIEATLADALTASPDVIVLADIARLTPDEARDLTAWVEKGGMLLRFAGPQLAASEVSRDSEDALMPMRLREGGRMVGGAMSWGEPKTLAPFTADSPFHGLAVPGDVTVSAQVLAQPDPDLAQRTIAALADGTPLVTRKALGQGQVVLFHVTANAEWSTLPLSGLFVGMLERLSVASRLAAPDAAVLEGQVWVPELALNGFGEAEDATTRAGVPGAALAKAMAAGPGPELRPGLYAGSDRRVALNAAPAGLELVAATWPAGVVVEGLEGPAQQSLKGPFLTAGLLALLADILAALALSGRLRAAAGLLLLAALPALWQGSAARADDATAIRATEAVVLAHVLTGDAEVDRVAEAGLAGLGERLWERTSVEPEPPMGVNIETDELSFFPFLYWPVTGDEPLPSAAAYGKLNAYLRTGGMILFDTRDADLTRGGGNSPAGQALQRIAAGLDIPALEPIPKDHVLTRSFYLLQDFPGRYDGATLWVEAAPPDAEQAVGMPFRNLNDGVTPVVIGGNDWAGAWAIDDMGVPMFPVGRGFAGERQREIANRFGINLIMHVLTGNYKSDQVHVPALLERLGQ